MTKKTPKIEKVTPAGSVDLTEKQLDQVRGGYIIDIEGVDGESTDDKHKDQIDIYL